MTAFLLMLRLRPSFTSDALDECEENDSKLAYAISFFSTLFLPFSLCTYLYNDEYYKWKMNIEKPVSKDTQ